MYVNTLILGILNVLRMHGNGRMCLDRSGGQPQYSTSIIRSGQGGVGGVEPAAARRRYGELSAPRRAPGARPVAPGMRAGLPRLPSSRPRAHAGAPEPPLPHYQIIRPS